MANTNEPPAIQDLSLGEKHASIENATPIRGAGSSGIATPAESTSETPATKPDSQQPSGPQRGPYPAPLPSCKPKERPALTAEQSQKFADFLETVKKWDTIPSTKGGSSGPISDDERMFLTHECLLRYLRATNWSATEAPKRLMTTLSWRRDYGVDKITADEVSIESETGKQHILGYDNNCRTCLYMAPGRQNTKKGERQIKHLVFMLERTVDLMPPGQDSCAILINFKGATSGGSPSVAQARETMTILQGHYPERLGRACVSELPWFINVFFKLIRPFIDPNTNEKIIFNGNLQEHVPAEQLDMEFGGTSDFVYEHDKYWPLLNKLCDERRAAYKQRWIDGGKSIGEYETYLRGGDHKPLREIETAAD